MQQIYVTDFIVPAFHNAMSDYTRKDFAGYSSLLKPIDEKVFQLRISNEFSSKVISLAEANEFKDEAEETAYKNFLAWIASSKVRPVTEEEFELIDYKEHSLRKSVAKLFSPSQTNEISSTIHDHEFDSATKEERKIQDIVKKLFISDSDISDNKYDFLFKVDELPLIDNKNKKSWYEYIYDYTVPTKTIRIIDPYFIKNNRDISIRTILGRLIGDSPFEEVDIEIITNLSKSFDDKEEEYKAKALDWVEENSDQPVNITIYNVVRNHTNYHDRYLWTDYWNLKVPAGIDGTIANKTIPTLVGRYSSNEGSWNYIDENWENWTKNDCEIIEEVK